MRTRNEYHPQALFPETYFFQLEHNYRCSQIRPLPGNQAVSGGRFTLESQCLLWWVCSISLNCRHSTLIYMHNMIMLNMFSRCHLLIQVVEHGTTFSSGEPCREHSLLLHLPFLMILVYAENCPDVFHSLWCLEGHPIPSCLVEGSWFWIRVETVVESENSCLCQLAVWRKLQPCWAPARSVCISIKQQSRLWGRDGCMSRSLSCMYVLFRKKCLTTLPILGRTAGRKVMPLNVLEIKNLAWSSSIFWIYYFKLLLFFCLCEI